MSRRAAMPPCMQRVTVVRTPCACAPTPNGEGGDVSAAQLSAPARPTRLGPARRGRVRVRSARRGAGAPRPQAAAAPRSVPLAAASPRLPAQSTPGFFFSATMPAHHQFLHIRATTPCWPPQAIKRHRPHRNRLPENTPVHRRS